MKRRRYSRQQWLAWLNEQPDSGLSVVAFCREKGISQKSFYAWRRKLADDLKLATSPVFVPVSVVPASPLQVEFPCGAKLMLPGDEAGMRRLLSILLELGAGQ